MKKLLFLILLFPFFIKAQTVVTLSTADTSKIIRTTGTTNAELVIRNQQRNVPGIAYNRSLGWIGFSIGTANQYLTTNGSATGISWVTPSFILPADTSVFARKTWLHHGYGILFNQTTGEIKADSSLLNTNFIRNSISLQASSNYNISGSGTIDSIRIWTGANSNSTNHFISRFGGLHITTAVENTSLGDSTAAELTTGIENLILGSKAGTHLTTGNFNVFAGEKSGRMSTTALANNFFGHASGLRNIDGVRNDYHGFHAGDNNLHGGLNNAFGYNSLFSNQATGNSAFGYQSFFLNTSGLFNAGFGFQVATNNTIGSYLAIFGANSAPALDGGNHNSLFGSNVAPTLTTGSYNSFFGDTTGRGITTGSNNTILGARITGLSSSLSNNIILSDGAGNIKYQYNSGLNIITNRLAITQLLDGTPGTDSMIVHSSSGEIKRISPSYYAVSAPVGSYITTDQSSPQTIGTTSNRLTKLYTTDLTVTNPIDGSITGNAGTVTTNANLTGPIISSGNATSIASQTGTGTKFVVDNTPTLITPNIGAATGTSLNTSGIITAVGLSKFWDATQGLFVGAYTGGAGYGAIYPVSVTPGSNNFAIAAKNTDIQTNASSTNQMDIAGVPIFTVTSTAATSTQPFTGSGAGLTGTASGLTSGSVTGLSVISGKTLTVNNTLALSGTDATTMTFPSTSAIIARTDAANTFTGVQTMTSPVFTTPSLGAATGTSLTNTNTANGSATTLFIARNTGTNAGTASRFNYQTGAATNSVTTEALRDASNNTTYTVTTAVTGTLTNNFNLNSTGAFTISALGSGIVNASSGTLSASTALANGTTATTQSPGNNTTSLATTAYVDAAAPVVYYGTAVLVAGTVTVSLSGVTSSSIPVVTLLSVSGTGTTTLYQSSCITGSCTITALQSLTGVTNVLDTSTLNYHVKK